MRRVAERRSRAFKQKGRKKTFDQSAARLAASAMRHFDLRVSKAHDGTERSLADFPFRPLS